jgi:Lon protease-like protein
MVGMANEHTADFPEHIGFMVLPWASLFPGGLMPLRIFEDRYRHMLSDALAGHRMFGIAHAPGESEEDLERIASIGVVRACVTNEDGTSSLILQGLARVVLRNETFDPYPAADITAIKNSEASSLAISLLRQSIQKHLLETKDELESLPKGFLEHLASIDSAANFSDLLASTIIHDPIKRRELLEELDVSLRMQMLFTSLLDEDSCEETEEP